MMDECACSNIDWLEESCFHALKNWPRAVEFRIVRINQQRRDEPKAVDKASKKNN